MNPNLTCLIIAEDPPESYSPAGERLRHMSLAGNSFFSKTVVLTLGKTKKPGTMGIGSAVFFYKTGFVRGAPFPISALFEPIRFLAFLLHGLVLSARYKPSCVVALMPPLETGVSGLFLTRLLRRALVIDYMDDWESATRSQLTRYIPEVLMKPAFGFARKVYSSSRVILAATPTLVNIMQQRGIKASIIQVPNGADVSIFFPRYKKSREAIRLRHAIPLSKIVVAYCGSGLNPYYRLDLILLAAKSIFSVAKRQVFFVFYLNNGIEHWRRFKDKLKIPDDLVQIREPLQRANLSEVMGSCDVGLVPFDDKAFLLYAMSTKMYEYLSAGLYVIGSGPEGGELDSFLCQNTNCGDFVTPRVEDFVGALLEAMKNAQSLLGDNSRASRHLFIEENYDSRTIMLKAMADLSNQRVLNG